MTPHQVQPIPRDWTVGEVTGATVVRQAATNGMWRFRRNNDLLLTSTPPSLSTVRGSRKSAGAW
jgi:hypothetical protein